ALTTNVMDADAGATRLRSPQERAARRLKKPTEKQHRAKRKRFSLKTLPIAASTPRLARSSSRSPMRFMALESRTSPPLERRTISKIALHSSSDLMLPLASAQAGFPRLWLSQGWAARNPAYAAANQ